MSGSATSLATVLEATFATFIANIHTCMPGTIETYDFKTQKATVQPSINKVTLEGKSIKLPILTNVPVMFPRTKKTGITFPLSRGDGVLIVFSERALERWYSNGGTQDPGDPRKFDLSDSIAIPGLYSFKDKNLASNNQDLEIQHEKQFITITKKGDIKVGKSSLKKLVNETFMSLFNSHTHLTVVYTPLPVPPPPIPSGPPVPLMNTTHLTSKVTAE